ncbi:sterol desaturase family protein [uncultured Nocardioides sp.]|uniref:sterol desaturase family protein n=1 Tax=uncultured Nocardioides sp. TaxID=198441 RepID=UPI0026016032|nr:sterol desaturase family protein [uncultured Nocardioides sp.]
MTRVDPRIEAAASRRLAADEDRITGQARRRESLSLRGAWREFWRHPSPPMITAALAVALTGRVLVGTGSAWELLVPATLLALFPLIEWVVHVVVLHWRPRRLGPLTLDSHLAREHRAHHADPRDLPLVFIPWRALLWLLPAFALAGLVLAPTGSWAWTFLVSSYAIMLGYEWTHYLVHSDYRPRSRWYRAVWRNHRLHHYKNEHYWFAVVTAGTADRVLGTYPEPGSVESSPTVRTLHATERA